MADGTSVLSASWCHRPRGGQAEAGPPRSVWRITALTAWNAHARQAQRAPRILSDQGADIDLKSVTMARGKDTIGEVWRRAERLLQQQARHGRNEKPGAPGRLWCAETNEDRLDQRSVAGVKLANRSAAH